MASISTTALDQAANWVKTNGTRLDICSSEPNNHAAISGVSLGNATVALTGPAAGSPDGRAVTVPVVGAGTTTGNGEVNFWALSNGSNTLVATGPVTSAPVTVSTVVDWSTSAAFDITFRAATAV